MSRVIAIGLSTGGVQAIEVLLHGLDRQTPGIVMVQHMPERFTAALAARLDDLFDLDVREAVHGDRVRDGTVLIAPGGRHMELRRTAIGFDVAITEAAPVNHHRPSVDVLFSSVARCAGPQALGIIMTGMGSDGARGLLEMRRAGAYTAAQDEASCVVYGMPAAAAQLGSADHIVPLSDLADWVRHALTLPLRSGRLQAPLPG
jgi:two-component system chemotaxis response regulator CheB